MPGVEPRLCVVVMRREGWLGLGLVSSMFSNYEKVLKRKETRKNLFRSMKRQGRGKNEMW